MPIEVQEITAPPKLSKEFEQSVATVRDLGFSQIGWLKVTVFSPLTVAGFVNTKRTLTLAVIGAATPQGLVPRALDLVTRLDNGAHITTTSAEAAISQPKHGIFKYSHRNADLEKLLRFHSEHCQEHKGKATQIPSTPRELANYLRGFLQYEMDRSIYRYWLIPARTVPIELRPANGPEGCYVSADSLSIRVIMDAGEYMWGAFGIHDAGSYKVIGRDEYSCDIEFRSKLTGSKSVRLTRKGKKYLFTPLPEGDSPNVFRRIDGGEFLADSRARTILKPSLAEGKPTGTFLPVRKTIEEFETGLAQNVRKEVIPYLIESGALNGKKVKKEWHVLDDAAFRRTMRFGIEPFVLNQQGWTFVAIKKPIATVASALRARKDVLKYKENFGAAKMRDDATISTPKKKRHMFLVKFRDTDWTVLIQTVHWIEAGDTTLAIQLAEGLSRELKTRAIAAWDDDFSGSLAILFNAGNKEAEFSTEEDDVRFDALFYSEGISIPQAFISGDAKKARLLMNDPASAERVDYAQISMPQ